MQRRRNPSPVDRYLQCFQACALPRANPPTHSRTPNLSLGWRRGSMANPHIRAGTSDLSQPLTKCHPATLPQPQPSPGVLAPKGTLSLEGKDLEQERSGSGWGRGFGSSRKSVRSLLSAWDGGSHTKVLDRLYMALSPHALPRGWLCWQLPFFHNKHGVGVQLSPTADPTGAGCGIGFPACTHHCCPALSLELLRCSTDPLVFKHWGGFPASKGHCCALAWTVPGHGIFGKRLPSSPLLGPPMVISRGGNWSGRGAHIALPAPKWGNATLGEITGNCKAEG